ncbi:MAG TPA: SpoIID/LytB domain-containing protein [Solirubrobacterales bacterium]|nr:SpoIID/LytB domain-containing protein [Solirubrobacterales bacterium]
MAITRPQPSALLLVSIAVAVAAFAPITASGAAVQVVRGAGFGHGIGMSQYGAYGMAQEGWGYERILRHYYKGTKLGQAPSRPVRVLLQASDPYVRFRGATRGPGAKALSPGVIHVVRPARGGRLALYGAGGRRLGTYRAPLSVSNGGRPMTLLGAAIQGVVSGRYRGTFDLYPGSAGGVTVVNALPIDDYVQGVVASEVPASWEADVLRAQAVTARTYALTTRKTGDIFDQYPDTRSQMYKGVVAETAATNAAVRRTAGEIVTHDGEPATTFYFSTSGGRTENIENSFIGASPQPWLKSMPDPYDVISPKHRWTVRFSNARMGALLGAPGTLRRVEVLSRGISPRVVRARIVGSRGSTILTGPQIRARLGLDDTWAYFTRVGSARAAARLARRWAR